MLQQINISVDETWPETINYVHDLMTIIAENEGSKTKKTEDPLTDPEAIISEKDLRWAEPRGPLQTFIASILYVILRVIMWSFFRLKVKELERVPASGSFILLPNHVSLLDAPALAVALGYNRVRRCFWSGYSRLLFRNVFMRSISRLAQVVPIEREDDPVSSLAFGALLLKRGYPLVWFPEGRVSPTGGFQSFREGIGLLLEHYNRPVIPVFIDGTDKALPPRHRIPRPAGIAVHFGEPVKVEDLSVPDEKTDDDERPYRRITRNLEKVLAQLRESSRGDQK